MELIQIILKSVKPLRGLKGSLYEGCLRVPLIARWPGQIAPGDTSDLISASWDMYPTFAELAGGNIPHDIDGISLLPELLNRGVQKEHKYLYWEFSKSQALRIGKWKAIRKQNVILTCPHSYPI